MWFILVKNFDTLYLVFGCVLIFIASCQRYKRTNWRVSHESPQYKFCYVLSYSQLLWYYGLAHSLPVYHILYLLSGLCSFNILLS
jgi:hypothetical protein